MDNKLLQTISLHLNNGHFTEALSLLKESENTYSNNAQFWEILALVQGMSGNNEECINACIKAIELNPDNIGTYINLSVAQQNLGRFEDTEKTLRQALGMDSNHPQVQNNMGSLYIAQSEHGKAKPFIEKAISLDPSYSDAHCNLGEIHKHFQQIDKAINSYLKSIELNVNNLNAYLGLGSLHSFQGNYKDAEYYLNYALKLNPYHPEILFNLGFLNYLKKSLDTAARYFKETIDYAPDHQYARYLLSAITGEGSPEQSPESYVKGLFNHYAEQFDEHLVNDLGYNVPDTMHTIFTEHANPSHTRNLLDLGCGTGICGEKFHNIFDHLTGVDLSENMIEKSKEKNIYHELHNDDVANFLKDSPIKYDLIIAADVFIYIGNIAEIIKSIYEKQEESGYFIFSIEKSSSHDTFHLRTTGRYSHNASHIKKLLDDASYNIVTSQPTIIRNEKGTGIEGIIYLCQK